LTKTKSILLEATSLALDRVGIGVGTRRGVLKVDPFLG
jgi:hypothetical protein